jgi:arsenate reductase
VRGYVIQLTKLAPGLKSVNHSAASREAVVSSNEEVIIYHNRSCSKSRATLDLIRARGIEPTVIEYLDHPPEPAQLERVLSLLGVEPRDLMRRKEPEYREANLDDPGLTRETLIQAMVQRPRLIERPIVLANGKAAIGRPPASVLDIL